MRVFFLYNFSIQLSAASCVHWGARHSGGTCRVSMEHSSLLTTGADEAVEGTRRAAGCDISPSRHDPFFSCPAHHLPCSAVPVRCLVRATKIGHHSVRAIASSSLSALCRRYRLTVYRHSQVSLLLLCFFIFYFFYSSHVPLDYIAADLCCSPCLLRPLTITRFVSFRRVRQVT